MSVTLDGEAGERVRQATAYLKRAMDRLSPAFGRQLVGGALPNSTPCSKRPSDVGHFREGLQKRFSS